MNPQLKIYMHEDDNFLRSIQTSCCCDLRVLENNAVKRIQLFKNPRKIHGEFLKTFKNQNKFNMNLLYLF